MDMSTGKGIVPARTATGRRVDEDRHFVTALARGLEVLACFRSGDRVLGNQEIAQRCGFGEDFEKLLEKLTQ